VARGRATTNWTQPPKAQPKAKSASRVDAPLSASPLSVAPSVEPGLPFRFVDLYGGAVSLATVTSTLALCGIKNPAAAASAAAAAAADDLRASSSGTGTSRGYSSDSGVGGEGDATCCAEFLLGAAPLSGGLRGRLPPNPAAAVQAFCDAQGARGADAAACAFLLPSDLVGGGGGEVTDAAPPQPSRPDRPDRLFFQIEQVRNHTGLRHCVAAMEAAGGSGGGGGGVVLVEGARPICVPPLGKKIGHCPPPPPPSPARRSPAPPSQRGQRAYPEPAVSQACLEVLRWDSARPPPLTALRATIDPSRAATGAAVYAELGPNIRWDGTGTRSQAAAAAAAATAAAAAAAAAAPAPAAAVTSQPGLGAVRGGGDRGKGDRGRERGGRSRSQGHVTGAGHGFKV